MSNLFYCVYETGRGGRFGEESLAKKIRSVVDANGVMAVNRGGDGYVLLRYEFDNVLSMSEVEEHFKNVTERIGKLSDKIGHELAIELKATLTGTVVTPDSLAKTKETDELPADECPADEDEAEHNDEHNDKDNDEDNDEDEWAEVLRLRDLSLKS